MITPHVTNETSRLCTVVLGLPDKQGPEPSIEQTYDAKSYDSVVKGIYPKEGDCKIEMQAVLEILNKYQVEVLRPSSLEDYNQVFARDVAFTIDDTLFVANLIADRSRETEAFTDIFSQVGDHLELLPAPIRVEGGDVLLYDDILFVGTCPEGTFDSYKTARTNRYAVDFLRDRFPHKTIVPIVLKKHDQNTAESVLHLDCAFQPVGTGKAIYYPKGFADQESKGVIEEIFGKSNLFAVTEEEAYYMNTNIFSISPSVVISEQRFSRLNNHLQEEWGIQVEPVPYFEISKMGGLLRCSTMPIVRE
ncbi:cytochrome C biogenesis protein CcmF [Porphyromonas crevioricanis]|uniref:arginine deiminase n=2 Tax=Porphyromonas crevioricanis TaxID=393921 RepID=A0A0A2FWV4_9PORP|nr:arginine deiminase family protein [Porphyromonas crevioricanis]KGN91066.1 cytochrome C biogenesis protein CcmF [Porphyromonas crevioricanis]KGN94662.1 cytochrome C biogenesis protein CcmF [Porphyromonas crevioricanis]SJZ57564.1 N-Dimethylarginine dimethylaminohydrolase [Porphyromonas crevioricanis]SQH73420.1 arginine deiminase [Porphyromonas crevioricanis]GAD06123.1 NG,NG-dimethylarginine dimethylaminohydrolase 1 [Porphyromonas crevioricanis JCM 15906]